MTRQKEAMRPLMKSPLMGTMTIISSVGAFICVYFFFTEIPSSPRMLAGLFAAATFAISGYLAITDTSTATDTGVAEENPN